MNLVELHKETMDNLKAFDARAIMPDLKDVAEGSLRDVLDKQNSLYYQYLACFINTYKPKQIIELGGAMGTAALCMVSQLPSAAKLYSITLEEHGLEFSYIKTNYPQLIKIVGDDLNMESWPKDIDFSKTDMMFIDALHTKEQVEKEMALYLPLIGKDKIVFMDDIKMDAGMFQAWLGIKTDKLDVSVLHHSGFGMFLS